MSEFDRLLQQVLRDEANVEPPGGMEARLASVISQEPSGRAGMSAFWRMAGAAAILIALIASQAFRHRSGATASSIERDERGFLTAGAASASETDFPNVPPMRPAKPAHSGHREMMRAVNRIAPIELERLVVRPIEIASLTSNSPASRGEIR